MLWLKRSAVLALLAASQLAPVLAERPIAIVLSGNGGFRKPASGERWSAVEQGVELYTGDSFESTVDKVTFAFCPGGDSDSTNQVMELRAGGVVQLAAKSIGGRSDLLTSMGPIPICVFPDLSRRHTATTQDFSYVEGQLPPALYSDQRSALDLANSMSVNRNLWLIAKITRAALLERFHQNQAALAEYREIRTAQAEATLTRQRIAVIGSAILPEASPAANSLVSRAGSGPSVAVNLVARTRTAAAPGVTDVEPDFSTGQQYALIIGISDYPKDQGISKLNFAAIDAETFASYLAAERGGQLPKEHIWKLTDQQATRDGIEKALTEFVQGKGGSANTLIVYIAAHGRYVCMERSPDSTAGCEGEEEPFIVVRDGGTQAPNISGYSMRRLRELVTKRAADFGRVLVFVDVCHGANVTWKGADQTLAPKEVIDALRAGGNHLGIMSASALVGRGARSREYAYESPDLKHGVFTYYLLRAMNGDAGAIDNKIVFSTLASTVQLKVQAFTKNIAQTPLSSSDTNELLPVVDNARLPPFLLEEERSGSGVLQPLGADPLSAEEERFQKEMAAGHLLELGGAADALEAIAARFHEDSPIYQISRDRYRVALEDQGQQTILRYLEGDQNLMEKSEFERCGNLFAAALRLAPDAEFDESRMLFCKGRVLLYPDTNQPYGSLLKDADFARAVVLLERSIRIDPGRSYSYNALGIGYLERSEFSKAVSALRTAIRFAPYWAYPRHNLALALTQEGRYPDALAAYGVAMAAGPAYSYLPYNVGLLYQQLADMPQAKTYYREAERLAARRCEIRLGHKFAACPERAPPLTGLGTLEAAQGRRKSAERLLTAALKDAPGDLTANHDLAFLLSKWPGREAEAEQKWKRNLASLAPDAPQHIPSLIGFSALLSRQQRYSEAVVFYKSILKAMPDYMPAQVALAQALIRTSALEQAKPLVDRLTARRQSSSDVIAVQAEYAARSGQDASQLWAEAIRRAPDRKARKLVEALRDQTNAR